MRSSLMGLRFYTTETAVLRRVINKKKASDYDNFYKNGADPSHSYRGDYFNSTENI